MTPRTLTRRWPVLFSILAATLIFGCSSQRPRASAAPAASPHPSSAALARLFADSDRRQMALDPLGALSRGDLRHADQFGDYISPDYVAAMAGRARQDLRQLQRIDRQRLTAKEQTIYDAFQHQAEVELRKRESGAAEILRQLPLDQLFGYHVNFPDMSSGQSLLPFATLADYESGLRRLDGFVTYLDRAREAMVEGIATGHTQAEFVTRKVLGQLEAALERGVDGSPLLQPTRAFPGAIAASDQRRLTHAYRAAIGEKVMPAFERLRDFMQEQYLPASRTDAPGLSGMPDGALLYAFLIEQHTSTQLGADEIHTIGLEEVARIRAEMEKIKLEVAFDGTLQDFFAHLRTDPQFTAATPEALLQAYENVWTEIEPRMSALFSHLPDSELEIRPVPDALAATAGGAYYYPGTADGARPGVFYVNTSDLPSRTIISSETLFLHEGMPGHHLQGSLALEDGSLPPFLRFAGNTAYVEGWALYAESLGPELGLFTDPYQHFGHLDLEMLRAMRLVVDTGLHAKGWSRQQAVDYMLDNSSLTETVVRADVDRYVVWPAQALAYKLGQLSIRRLRQQAEAALEERFDLAAFHQQVLDTGALPLPILERKITRWIENGG